MLFFFSSRKILIRQVKTTTIMTTLQVSLLFISYYSVYMVSFLQTTFDIHFNILIQSLRINFISLFLCLYLERTSLVNKMFIIDLHVTQYYDTLNLEKKSVHYLSMDCCDVIVCFITFS
jgi:hypothetical protein